MATKAAATAASIPPLPPWGNALAGATGAVLANAIVYPLDMYGTSLCSSSHIRSTPRCTISPSVLIAPLTFLAG